MTKQWKTGDPIELDMQFSAMTVSDMPDGFIAGIASAPSMDLYGHKVLSGAFEDSIRRKGLAGPRGVKLLIAHDWSKPAGIIKRLETNGGGKLEIEAQLNLGVSYVRDIYEITKQNGGLNYSVGFRLGEFDLAEEEKADEPWLIVKSGDLMEVSVVVFPAQVEAEMLFFKQGAMPPNSLTEFEKTLVVNGLCRNRTDAQKIVLATKKSLHLFQGRSPGEAPPTAPQHPLVDANQLKAATDLVAKAKAILSSR